MDPAARRSYERELAGSPLMELPVELRVKIYGYVLDTTAHETPLTHLSGIVRKTPALFQVSTQIHDEACSVFYASQTFVVADMCVELNAIETLLRHASAAGVCKTVKLLVRHRIPPVFGPICDSRHGKLALSKLPQKYVRFVEQQEATGKRVNEFDILEQVAADYDESLAKSTTLLANHEVSSEHITFDTADAGVDMGLERITSYPAELDIATAIRNGTFDWDDFEEDFGLSKTAKDAGRSFLVRLIEKSRIAVQKHERN